MRSLTPSMMPSSIGASSKTDHRHALVDPTKNLLQCMNTRNAMRIKAAINTPCADVNVRLPNQQQMTILMGFCYMDISPKSRKDLTTLALTKACQPNARDINGRTVLTHACLKQDEALIMLLSADGNVDPTIADVDGNSPLMYACRTGNANVVTTLITAFKKYGLNVNVINDEGISPLIEAARLGYTDVCRTLILTGHADVNQRDTNCNSAQDHLVLSGADISTPDLLLLSPIAQRKSAARERREAAGRRSLSEFVNAGVFAVRRGSAWTRADEDIKRKASVKSEDGTKRNHHKNTKRKITYSESATESTIPLTEDHLRQLYSVVFQVAIRLPMISEKPVEEEVEDIERQSRNMFRRPRSRSLSKISDYHQFVTGKYSKNNQTIETWLNESNMAPGVPKYKQNGGTLPPLTKTTDYQSGSRDSRNGIQQSARGNTQMSSKDSVYSRRGLSPAMNSISSSSHPSSPYSTCTSSSSSSADSQRSGQRLPTTDAPTDVIRIPRRRSSMPQLEDLPKQPLQPSPPPSPRRRVTYPGGTKSKPQQPNERTKADSAPDVNRFQRRRSSMPQLEDLPVKQLSPPSSPRHIKYPSGSTSQQNGSEKIVKAQVESHQSVNRFQRRRSSMPKLEDLPSSQMSPSTPSRRHTQPSVTVSKAKQPVERERNLIIYTKFASKSRPSHSWEGKPSSAIPSYLFR